MSTAHVDVEGRNFVITFPFNRDLLKIVKDTPSRRFVDKDHGGPHWTAPVTEGNIRYLGRLAELGRFTLSPAAEQAVTGVVVNSETLTYASGNTMQVHLPDTAEVRSMIGPLFGMYDPKHRAWNVRLAAHSIDGLGRLVDQKKLNASDTARAEIARRMPSAVEQLHSYRELLDLSSAKSSEFDVDGLGGELRPSQRAGVEYGVRVRRYINGDEPGLGKTIQALAVILATGTFPAIVAAPPIVKSNWADEARKWLPGKRVEVLAGTRTPDTLPIMLPDVWIVNYDVLYAWEPWLVACSPKSFTADESHYLKNSKARWTIAAQRIADAVPDLGVVQLLSGTPVVNHEEDLISQFQIIGRTGDLGGKKYFLDRYANKLNRPREGDSAAVLEAKRQRRTAMNKELHRRMRATCFVRRLKKDVLEELEEKERAPVLLDVKLGTAYAEVKSDVVRWLQANPDATDSVKEKKIDLIKQEIARDKMPAAIDWIKNFLDGGRKLVVFAYNIAQQEQLVEAFPDCAEVRAAPTDAAKRRREAAIKRFQTDDDCRIAICSIKASREGITLTAASDVAFVQMGWTPSGQDQAEDRCHRIGQKDSVTAWYLLAKDTEDVDVAELIDAKRQVTTAIIDGREATEDESIVTEMTKRLLMSEELIAA